MNPPSQSKESRPSGQTPPRTIPLSAIQATVQDVRHGSVMIIIQDGVVVQIDKTEKFRLR